MARGPTDTIIALASGNGRAGVAVIRTSGPGSADLLRGMTGGVSRETPLPELRKAATRTLRDVDGGFLDEALVLWMPGPASYTGEDVVELHVHGGAAVIEAVIQAALKTRLCRVAEPGEFTRRAFDAGRMDLTQAEAIGDLIDAETEGQRRQAGLRSALVTLGALTLDLTSRQFSLDGQGIDLPPRERALLVADLHLEKASFYARFGQMLPPYDTRETLDRLDREITALAPARLIFLGDSFHDALGETRLAKDDVTRLTSLARGRDLVWAVGNHDEEGPRTLPGQVVDELEIGRAHV